MNEYIDDKRATEVNGDEWAKLRRDWTLFAYIPGSANVAAG